MSLLIAYFAEMHCYLQLASQIIAVDIFAPKFHQVRIPDIRPVSDVILMQTIISKSYVRCAWTHTINVTVVLAAVARRTSGAIGRRVRTLDACYAKYIIQQHAVNISVHCKGNGKEVIKFVFRK